MSGKRVPQDRKPKKSAVDRLRDEARSLPGMDALAGLTLTVAGKGGTVTVDVLENPLDWEATVPSYLQAGDYLAAICGCLSDADAAKVRAVRPTIGQMLSALMEPQEDSGEPSVGEPQAS